MTKRYYPYNACRNDLKILTQKIDKEFDTIVAIARGGLILSLMLGEYYDIRKVYSINTIGYEGETKLENVKVNNIPNLKNSTRVLIVDDIVDSGDTLTEVLKVLESKYPRITFYSASLFYRPTAQLSPDWYVVESDEWIEFFWSEDLKDKNEI